MANAFYNAYTNAKRKKRTKPVPLWKKKSNKKDSVTHLKRKFKEVEAFEESNGKDWVRAIYEGRG